MGGEGGRGGRPGGDPRGGEGGGGGGGGGGGESQVGQTLIWEETPKEGPSDSAVPVAVREREGGMHLLLGGAGPVNGVLRS